MTRYAIEVVQMFDSASRMPMGFVGLGEFVPYRKAPVDGAAAGDAK